AGAPLRLAQLEKGGGSELPMGRLRRDQSDRAGEVIDRLGVPALFDVAAAPGALGEREAGIDREARTGGQDLGEVGEGLLVRAFVGAGDGAAIERLHALAVRFGRL